MQNRETLAVVIPVYNEAECIDELMRRLLALRERCEGVDMCFVFVDDGSQDASPELLRRYAGQYAFVQVLRLTRNFGHQLATTAGLDQVDADYAVIMDADLQDPPELVAELYAKAKEGYDIVYAKRSQREGESFLTLTTATLFYRLLNILCQVPIPADTGDFRLISRRVLEVLRTMRERHRFIRGLIPWTGFPSAPVEYRREPRHGGDTKFTYRRMLAFAVDALTSFSKAPLRLASGVGLAAVLLGVLGGIVLLYLRFFTTYKTPGITGVILTVLFMSGIQIMMIGLVGEYIGKIFEENKGRPLYVVDERVNLDGAPVSAPASAQQAAAAENTDTSGDSE